jgi:ACS family phthalate transporter-like MFS transporter
MQIGNAAHGQKRNKIILDALAADRDTKPAGGAHRRAGALKDPRVYILAAGRATVPLCGTISNYWTPTIIRQDGITDVFHVGLLSVLPCIVRAPLALLCRHFRGWTRWFPAAARLG